MRAVATALVLIIGAAVVLWYGNTLNSWVLGGLIGGLAALLLSIPISLTLFSYFSRRHDDQLRADVEEELERAQIYPHTPQALPARVVHGTYAVAEYQDEEVDWDEEEAYQQELRAARHLPVPTQQRLPREQPASNRPRPRTGPTSNRKAAEPPTRYEKENTTRHPNSRRLDHPGQHSHELTPAPAPSQQSLHRSAALRAARREAAQQSEYDDAEIFPTTPARRLPSPRSVRPQSSQAADLPSKRQPSQSAPHSQYRPRRTIDSTPPLSSLPMPSKHTSPADHYEPHHPHTEYATNNYPQTTPIRQQLPPQTGQIVRNPHLEQQRRNPDVITGSLNAPMVRRAPYLYEDDPLLHELEQHIDTPTVRRSSRQEIKHHPQEQDHL